MYNQAYEDYLRNVLGVQMNYNNNIYENYNRNDYYLNEIQTPSYNTYGMSREQIESCFPEIYRIINPLVIRTWNINTKPITIELIEEIENQIYETIDDHKEIRLNINLTNEIRNKESKNEIKSKDTKVDERTTEDRTTNYLLKDLIRILIVKNLLERQTPIPPYRPPIFPPFQGNPGPAPRPPIPPRPQI